MEKRYRDTADDESASAPTPKRIRLNDVASAALATGSSAMQAVAYEALAMGNGSGFTAINKDRLSAGAAPPSSQPPQPLQTRPSPKQQPPSQHSSTDHRRNSTSNAGNAGSRIFDSAQRVVMPGPAGHPATSVDRPSGPLDTISDITRRFRAAVVDGWSRRSPTYFTADVMLIYWEDDELEVKTSVSALETAFRTSLNYPTELYTIRSSESSLENIRNKVDHFFKRNQALDRLAILFYSGQCISHSTSEGQSLFLVPRNRRAGGTLPFAPIQAAYESTGCDVLVLMDHSEAMPFPTLGQRTNSRNVVELVVAPTPDPELGLMSFTKALTEELSKASYENPFKMESLHATISHRMSLSKPRGRGRPPKEPQARPPVDQQYLPKHQSFFHRRSVVFAPLPKEPQVIICLRVLGGAADINEWGKWIFAAGPKARNTVQFEGLYSGFSTMLALRVPVAEWHSFPPCPAVSFVGYTTIGEIPPKTQDRIDGELSAKLWSDEPALPAPPVPQHKTYSEMPPQPVFIMDSKPRAPDVDMADASGPRKPRKALPTERKLLPSGASPSPLLGRRKDVPPLQAEPPHFRPTQQHLQQYRDSVHLQSRHAAERDLSGKNAQLEAAAQKPFKISIKHNGLAHMCKECDAGFKDVDTLHNHVRKQHTRPFHCVFNWAGCESTFASKNEWKRHVMSQHILLHYWVCQVEPCCKIVNKGPSAAHSKFSLPDGAIFNRKDLYTQHLRRMHTPVHVKKLTKQAKSAVKPPSHPAITDWESHLKELQEGGIRPRCRLPDFMLCPAEDCASEFHGNNAWDERMEHVARHLESAATGSEPTVVFGGPSDPTLTEWATRYEVGIAKRVGPNTWHLDNPLRPEIMEWAGDPNTAVRAVAGGGDVDVDEAQRKYQAQAESYQQQNQYLHQYQHQHFFQVAPQPTQKEAMPQYEPQPTQNPFPPQYADRKPDAGEHTQPQPQRQTNTAEMPEQPMGDTASIDLARSAIEAAEKKRADRQEASPPHSLAAEARPNKAALDAPAEAAAEEHVVPADSSVESTTDATTPTSVAIPDETASKRPLQVFDNDDDERPNEDVITVATGSPHRN